MMSVSTVEDAYQATLKAEEKLARRQSQRSIGGKSSRGKGTSREKFQKSNLQDDTKHSHQEKGIISKEGQHGRQSSFPIGRGRGRGIGGIVKCYTCGKEGYKSWEWLDRKREGREAHISEVEKHVEAEAKEGGRNLMMRKVLLKPEKEPKELVQ
jgi:hypothetical protein